jgi:hypothetical protein
LKRPRKRCSNTGGINISDDNLYDGYLVDDDGEVIGEARRYDPYSKFGEIMLYEIDSFGFVPGYIKKGLRLMSEEDMMSDENLRKSLESAKYETWKRYNIIDLIAEYDQMFKNRKFFETFCKRIYQDVLEKKKKGSPFHQQNHHLQ